MLRTIHEEYSFGVSLLSRGPVKPGHATPIVWFSLMSLMPIMAKTSLDTETRGLALS